MLQAQSLIKKFKHTVLVPILGCLLVGYFAFYTMFGERSLTRLMHLEKQIAVTQNKADALDTEHDALLKKVQHLRPNALDADLLDERARDVLNYTAADEIVVMTPQPAKLKR